MLTTAGLLAPQEGQQIRSTVIKYQNLKRGSKLYDQVKEHLERLQAFHEARYKLQQSGFALQKLLDTPLVNAGEISRSNYWKFKLVNKRYAKNEATGESRFVAANIYCWDTPDEDFTTKLPAYLPAEKADEYEIGFLNLGEVNEPQTKEQSGTQTGTSEGTKLQQHSATVLEGLKTVDEQLAYYRALPEADKPYVFALLKGQVKKALQPKMDNNERLAAVSGDMFKRPAE
jgi:hypothetical protein